jgi:hypothetical protein
MKPLCLPLVGALTRAHYERSGNEAGMTLLSFLVLVAIGGLLGTLALRLAPVYLNHYKVLASLNALKNQPEWTASSREQLVGTLQKRWDIDSVDDVTAKNVTISREGQTVKVQVTYDVTRPFVRNIDLVVHFDEAIEAVPR